MNLESNSATATDEENFWREAAAAYDDGKGLLLEEIDPDDEGTMKEVYAALKVNTIGAKTRLNRFIRRLRQQREPPVSQQQFSENARAGLELMAEDYLSKKKTIVLSDASYSSKSDLIDMLGLPEKGASWRNKPDLSLQQRTDGYSWLPGDEDSIENRTAYMAHLRNLLQLPANYTLADMQPYRQLLTVEIFRQTPESKKIRGTTDVVIARSEHVHNEAVRNNIETLFELKTTKNMLKKDHTPQVIGEHFAAAYLNPNHPVVSVLTDLNKKWTFFWFARGEDDDSRMALYKLCLNGGQSTAEAKYILDRLYDGSLRNNTLPTTFANRQPFQAVLDGIVRDKRSQRGFYPDRNDSNLPDQDSKPSPSAGGVDRHPTSGTGGGSTSTNRGTGHQTTDEGDSGARGAGPMSMVDALSLFAPSADRDVANELDLLDMVDENEEYEAVRAFAAKHIVPFMRPVE